MKNTTQTTQIQNYLYCTDHFYKDSAKADIKFWAVKGYLLIPESQLSLNKEGEAESSSWSTSCLNRLPGWKLSALSAFVDGGVCRKREKGTAITEPCKHSHCLLSQMPLIKVNSWVNSLKISNHHQSRKPYIKEDNKNWCFLILII